MSVLAFLPEDEREGVHLRLDGWVMLCGLDVRGGGWFRTMAADLPGAPHPTCVGCVEAL